VITVKRWKQTPPKHTPPNTTTTAPERPTGGPRFHNPTITTEIILPRDTPAQQARRETLRRDRAETLQRLLAQAP
jgi:hypothetical protein